MKWMKEQYDQTVPVRFVRAPESDSYRVLPLLDSAVLFITTKYSQIKVYSFQTFHKHLVPYIKLILKALVLRVLLEKHF